ncbi:MAG: adenylyl-sulfate kinase [Anaerolineae bacterium]|nr:MAG: adenylyl-sulfate kinase [Anaerolineae bacterium]
MASIDEKPGFVLWMTGLSGAGKTTIAKILEGELRARGLKVERLDGDIIRQNLTKDLGFTKEDRAANIERVTFVAKLLSRNGVACICSFISPYQSIRDKVRMETTNFLEVFIDADLESLIERDVKGLYKKAIAGEIPNFTGISDPYEPPEEPDIYIQTEGSTPLECANLILEILEDRGLLPLPDLY